MRENGNWNSSGHASANKSYVNGEYVNVRVTNATHYVRKLGDTSQISAFVPKTEDVIGISIQIGIASLNKNETAG